MKMNVVRYVFLICLFICFLPSASISQAQPHVINEFCYVTQTPKAKIDLRIDSFKTIQKVPESLEMAGIKLLEKEFQYFIIQGTDSMLVVKSLEFVRKEEQNDF